MIRLPLCNQHCCNLVASTHAQFSRPDLFIIQISKAHVKLTAHCHGNWSYYANIELINSYYLCFRKSFFSNIIVIRKPSPLLSPFLAKVLYHLHHLAIWPFLLQFRRFWRSVWPITSKTTWQPCPKRSNRIIIFDSR